MNRAAIIDAMAYTLVAQPAVAAQRIPIVAIGGTFTGEIAGTHAAF